MNKYKFRVGHPDMQQFVIVMAPSHELASMAARGMMDEHYEAEGLADQIPVAWSLFLLEVNDKPFRYYPKKDT